MNFINDNKMFEFVYEQANIKGMNAGCQYIPEPMIVGTPKTLFGNEIDYEKPIHYISDGVCGFAWIELGHANHKFCKWLLKHNYAHKNISRAGITIWIHDHNQSLDKKTAHASAMAEYINLNIKGLKYCRVNSRMD